MAKYKIGATDGGDAGLDLSWKDKMNDVDGAVLITKHITREFIRAVKDLPNVIVHITCTGYGGTVLEPNVYLPFDQYRAACRLVAAGFPKDRIVVRVDPIIPTPRGIKVAAGVIKMFMVDNFCRYRVSLIDMYPHVRDRFRAAGLPLPYNGNFSPSLADEMKTDMMLERMKKFWEVYPINNSPDSLRIEACAEPGLREAIQCGCVSEYDLRLMGLIDDDEELDEAGYQRNHCLCYSGKVELLTSRKPCDHKCLYCFWKDVKQK